MCGDAGEVGIESKEMMTRRERRIEVELNEFRLTHVIHVKQMFMKNLTIHIGTWSKRTEGEREGE